jgi:hypothetical protein
MDTMHTQVERDYQVFDTVPIFTWPGTERPLLIEAKGQPFTSIDDTQLVIVMVDVPGNCRLVLKFQLFIVAVHSQFDTPL